MGNNASNQYEQINNKTDFTFTYQLLKKVNEPHYGEVKVVRDIKTGEQIFLKEVVLTTKDTYQAELDFYNKRISVSHPNVVRIFGCNGTDQQNFCSSYYKISVFIEMLPKTLANELESRFETGVPFSENDILLIAENLIAGLSYFEAQDVFHGDIRPENIFVSNNAYKLSDPNLYPQKSANALSHVLLGNAKTLLSPELLVQVPHNDFQIKCNKFKADVFSLGATLLSLASLTDARELYDYENGAFDLDGLQERLELVRKTYSKFTFELIRDMLSLREEQRPDFIALSNRLLPYQEDIRQKYELPFFGIRAPYEEKKEEDHLDISRYTYEEKSNPVLMDFINSQMSQSSVKRKPQRDSNGSSSRAEDITPGHNAFGRERDNAQESYRKSGNLMAEFEKAEVNQSPYHHHHHHQQQQQQQEVSGYMQSHLAEQLYRENPTRNPFQGRGVQEPQFEQNRRIQPYPILNIQQHQEHHPSYQTGQVDTSRSSQVRNEAPVEVFERQHYEPQPQTHHFEQQVHYEAPKRSYAQEPQSHRQLDLHQQQQPQPQLIQQQQQQQQQVYFQPQIQYQTIQTPSYIEPKVPLYLTESQIQAQVQRQENTSEPHGESNDLDDLEAKIKAALERSEATYRRAAKPAYSPDKQQLSAKKSAPPAEITSYQLSYSAQPTQKISGYDIPDVPGSVITSSSVYVKPAEIEDAYVKPTNLYSHSFAKGTDLNNSPPAHSEVQTNVQSNENTLYDFNPTFLSQSGVSNGNYYATTPGYTSQYNQTTSYPTTLQYQQRQPSGESWERAGVDKNFYSFATPLGHDTLQRHEHNALINGEHKNLVQHVIQD